jgi:hypothetical protein
MEQEKKDKPRDFVGGFRMRMFHSKKGDVCAQMTVNFDQMQQQFLRHTLDGRTMKLFFYPFSTIRSDGTTHFAVIDNGLPPMSQFQSRGDLHPADRKGATGNTPDKEYWDDDKIDPPKF